MQYKGSSQSQVNVNVMDIWKLSQKQINKLKPQQKIYIKRFQANKSKSIQQVFSSLKQQQVSQLIPSNSSQIITTNRQVPQSVKFLDYYSQRIGFLPMGQIYQKSGNKYIGRSQQITSKGQIFYKGFPNFKSQTSVQSPNLVQTLSYKAIRAIQKWNQFVSAQAQLAQFLQESKNPQQRKKLVIKYAKSCSLGTDILKMLSSLYYLYFDQKSPNTNYLQHQDPQYVKKKLLDTIGKDLIKSWDQLMRDQKINVYKNFRKLTTNRQAKITSILSSLTPQQHGFIAQYLDDKLAYVPDQMIKQNVLKSDQWLNNLKRNPQSSCKLVTSISPIGQRWFRAVNYITQ